MLFNGFSVSVLQDGKVLERLCNIVLISNGIVPYT